MATAWTTSLAIIEGTFHFEFTQPSHVYLSDLI